MMPSNARLWSYLLPLREPIWVRGQKLRMRSGLIIQHPAEDGGAVLAEASPLPGYSPDAMDQALQQFCLYFSRPPERHWWIRVPSVQCALDMLANSSAGAASVAVNGLALGDPDLAQEEEIRRLRACGVVKIKVGQGEPQESAQRVKCWSERLGADVRLRLDANQGWGVDEAISFWQEVNGLPVEYVEEPVRDIAELREFAQKTQAPLALDESLMASDILSRAQDWNLQAVILKPMALGGLEKAREIARRAADMGARAVVSSLFESSVGLAHLVHWAALLPNASTHHGLDTAGLLVEDTLRSPLIATSGRLDAPPLNELSSLLKVEWLREVENV